jgi:hypothetical protein
MQQHNTSPLVHPASGRRHHQVDSLPSHHAANLMSITPKSSWPWVRALLQSVYDHPDAASVHAQFDRILDAVGEKLPAVAAHLDAARADVLAFTGFPRQIWRQIWSNNPKSGSTGRTAKREWLSPMFNASMDPDDPRIRAGGRTTTGCRTLPA